jgi:hypothetical protein
VWLAAAVGDRVDEYDDIVGYHLEQAYRYRGELGATPDNGVTLDGAVEAWRGRAARRGTDVGDAGVPSQPAQEASGRGPRHGV